MKYNLFSLLFIFLVFGSACTSLPHRYIAGNDPLVSDTLHREGYVSSSKIFSNYHGLRGDRETVFYGGGKYNIHINSFDLKPTPKNKSKIKKHIDSEAVSDTTLVMYDLSIERFIKKISTDTLTFHHSFYVIGLAERTDVIGFNSYFPEDFETELAIVRSYLTDGLYSEAITPVETDSINFAGRDIKFPILCAWSGPNNIRCGSNGQLSWTVHDSFAEAVFSKNINIYNNAVLGDYNPTSSDTLSVYFEGEEATAIKHIYRIKRFLQILGVPSSIVVYYIATPVREQYVAATMSHFIDEASTGELPALLGEVMELKDNRLNKSSGTSDELEIETPETQVHPPFYPSRMIEFKTGLWIPVSKLAKTMHPSGFGAIQFNPLPFLSGQFRYIYNRKTTSFDFRSESEGQIIVTSNAMATLDLRVSSPTYLSNNSLLNRYIGVGISILETNEKDPSKANTKNNFNSSNSPGNENYNVETVGFVIGSSFIWRVYRKSMVGIFAEYNFAPYGINKSVSQSIGSHAFAFGFNFNF